MSETQMTSRMWSLNNPEVQAIKARFERNRQLYGQKGKLPFESLFRYFGSRYVGSGRQYRGFAYIARKDGVSREAMRIRYDTYFSECFGANPSLRIITPLLSREDMLRLRQSARTNKILQRSGKHT